MVYRHLNEKDRFYIEQRLSEGDSLRSNLLDALGFSPSTISREIKRHTPIDFKGLYCHRLTSRCAQENELRLSKDKLFQQIFSKR
ncbi:helix-turn-helix domain-containing protein [Piscirickettsia salmonis]|uniref:helix-turn-helix domain-containing protein n=1 Tax=Piscirickettsia salmonis TaxID=1238 RepID=UPI00053BDBE8|nr:helix-turn-helix domain-containing protein [Piscirickettsia salmonis]